MKGGKFPARPYKRHNSRDIEGIYQQQDLKIIFKYIYIIFRNYHVNTAIWYHLSFKINPISLSISAFHVIIFIIWYLNYASSWRIIARPWYNFANNCALHQPDNFNCQHNLQENYGTLIYVVWWQRMTCDLRANLPHQDGCELHRSCGS